MVGATAFILGVDCFTTAGLKEVNKPPVNESRSMKSPLTDCASITSPQFYVWNLGFEALFPVFAKIGFGISQTIAIELGLIAAVALAGAAVQMRLLTVLKLRLQQIKEEHHRRDAELEAKAQERFKDVEAAREEWEKKYGHHESKQGSVSTSMPLLNHDGATVIGSPGGGAESDTPGTPTRPVSSLFSFPGLARKDSTPMAGPATFEAESSGRPSQSPGLLPTLELGSAVKDQLPTRMISTEALNSTDDDPEIKRRMSLLGEIRDIRKSLDALSTTSYSTRIARSSLGHSLEDPSRIAAAATSRAKANEVQGGTGRERVRSMFDMTPSRPLSTVQPAVSSNQASGSGITRPTSTPLSGPGVRDGNYDWETYVAERKLFVPPSGVTPPIPTSEMPASLLPVARPTLSSRPQPSEAVLAAVAQRQKREEILSGERSISPSPLRNNYDVEAGGGASGSGETGDGATDAGTGARDRSSWMSFKNWDPRKQFERTRTHSSGGMLQTTPESQGPINILPPATRRNTGAKATSPPTSPQQRTLTYEEYQERHKSRIHALQEPLSQATQKEAQLSDARSRWERSKDIEGKVMKQREVEKQRVAEERARAEKEAQKRKSRGLSADLDTDLEAQDDDREKRRRHQHRRTRSTGVPAALSEGVLHSPSGPSRMSSSVKVEEWQKFQAANGPGSPPLAAGSSSRPAHARGQSQNQDLGRAQRRDSTLRYD